MSLLKLDGVSKEFGGILAVANLHYEIDAGAIHSIIGPNGAGKTTLFNLITGVYAPTSGRIYLAGEEVTGFPPHRLAQRGVTRTFQNLQIFFNMTALENVMVGMHLGLDRRLVPALIRTRGIAAQERRAREAAAEIMRFTGLSPYLGTAAEAMPYGALKRLEIARALALEPKLLLLDEPAAGLNAVETREVEALIRKVSAKGVTVVLVEHDMRLVMGVSDHVLVLDYGRKLAEGTVDEVRSDADVIAAYLGSGAAGSSHAA